MSAIATIRQGRIEGLEEKGLLVFKGIPYAAPPTGRRRWMPPESPESWSGVRPAKTFAHAAPQPVLPGGVLAALTVTDPQDEDCLYLNVWTPGLHGRRPVLVWIHGGGFQLGAGSQAIYDGATLARRGDAVVVTINYRLGPFGFLRLADITDGRIPSTGMEGMLDQVAALEWVRNNIAELGGDPGNVTIFGESAGGMSCGTLLGMPAARGLFHKAIPQSGACHTALSTAVASEIAARLLRKSGCPPTDADRLRSLSWQELLAVSPSMLQPEPEDDGLPFLPVVDGTNLPRLAIESVEQGASASVAVLVGSTSEEWKLFAAMDPGALSLDETGLGKRLGRRLDAGTTQRIIPTYRTSRSGRGEPSAPADLYCAIETDRMFGIPALRLAEAQSAHEPRVYRYLFTWKSPGMGGLLGACHGLELGFVFGTTDVPGMPEFCGTGPSADALALGMQDAWLAFARDGDPSCEQVGEWRAFDAASANTMMLGERPVPAKAPFDDENRAWQGVPNGALGR